MTALGPIVQIAYFVPDAREAAARMAATHGAGPFHVIDRIELEWGEVRGERADFLHTSAYGQHGSVMMELVQQDEEGPSPFRLMYGPGETGIHHVATMVDSLAETYAELEAAGMELAAKAMTATGTEFAFVDTIAELGHLTEIYERSNGLLRFYEMVRASSVDWDGSDAVRTLG